MKVLVAGHRGMVGSAVSRAVKKDPSMTLLFAERSDVDLSDREAVQKFFSSARPDAVVLAAAKVGGIEANNADKFGFLFENLKIQLSVIEAAKASQVPQFVFLGSSCIYPRDAEQPIPESALLTGSLEQTNEGYALAKIAGLKAISYVRESLGEGWFSLMPTNLYGIGDNYHPTKSHVIPGLIQRFEKARIAGEKSVTVWGTGKPLREFLFADDLGEIIHSLISKPCPYDYLNIGSGVEVSISELATVVSKVVGFDGEIIFDKAKPDGTPRKRLDIERQLSLGLLPRTSLEDGLRLAVEDFRASQ